MASKRAVGIWVAAAIFVAIVAGYWLGKGSQDLKLFGRKGQPALPAGPSSPAVNPAEIKIPSGSSDFEKRVILAANQAMPAVVNIYTEKKVAVQPNPFTPFFNDPFFRRFFGMPQFNDRPQEQIQRGLGSGVIISAEGYILTNNHVVGDADLIKISLSDKRAFTGKVIGKDPKTDLALVKINAGDLPSLPLANSDKVEIGQFVLAIGNPFGLTSTVTSGIISARGRANLNIAEYEDYIQTDAAINPGNSGGALVDLDGELVGINSAILSQSGGSLGIGFAIPSNMARAVMESLIKFGKVTRGFLGISIQDLTPELKKSFKFSGQGVLVAQVVNGSPAEKAGLKPGDIITEYRGRKLTSAAELKTMVGATAPGESAEITVFRDGKTLKLSADITELKEQEPASAPSQERPARLGLAVQDLTPSLRQRMGAAANLQGAVITQVDPGSRADAAGIRQGDVVLRVNQTLVKNSQDFLAAAQGVNREQVLLWIWREGRTVFVVIPPSGGGESEPETQPEQ